MSNITIKTVTYSAEKTAINTIRIKVFQEEQGIDPALEFDGLDETAEHLLAYLDNLPVGTGRIRYLDDRTAKIERLAVLSPARGRGIGKQMMTKAIAVAGQKDVKQIVISAQEYVKVLYIQLGFVQEGGIFDEAGIPHVKMKKVLG